MQIHVNGSYDLLRLQGLAFHVNFMWRQITWNVKSYFQEKWEKYLPNFQRKTKQTLHMKYQDLFSGEKNKMFANLPSAVFA